MPSSLPADLHGEIERARERLRGFDRVEHFADVASTNDLALERAAEGAPHGTVVIADAQHAGRGRHGRVWHSPPDAGIYLSAVLRANNWSETLSLVTLAAGLAVADGLREATGLSVELKWPNDVVVGRPWRKLAGILSETAASSRGVEAVVVGIGINLRGTAFPPEMEHRATAVEVELGQPVDRAHCVTEVLVALAQAMSRLRDGDCGWVTKDWRRLGAAGLRGSPVRWDENASVRRGAAVDIDDTGALLVDSGGRVERVISGEVIWERLSRE